jgi:hypothetical protein
VNSKIPTVQNASAPVSFVSFIETAPFHRPWERGRATATRGGVMGSIRCTLRSLLLFLLIASIGSTAASQAVLFTGVYHEAGCPSVDTTRMVRMNATPPRRRDCFPRSTAIRMRLSATWESAPPARRRPRSKKRPVPERVTSMDTRGTTEPPSKVIHAPLHNHEGCRTELSRERSECVAESFVDRRTCASSSVTSRHP